MRVLESVILRLDEYPDITKATIGSVLSAIAIEARVIPYAELTAIKQYLTKVHTCCIRSRVRKSAL